MQRKLWLEIVRYIIASVWFINGLFCKVLNLVPRHQLIVARILGDNYAAPLTRTIGVLEILMAMWILSKAQHRLCVVTQLVLVAAMNITEFILAPHLLLFGRFNILVASLFIVVLVVYERMQRVQSSNNFAI